MFSITKYPPDKMEVKALIVASIIIPELEETRVVIPDIVSIA